MWVFTSAGFVSVVVAGDGNTDPDLLSVRARDKESLKHMIDGINLAGRAVADKNDAPFEDEDIEIKVKAFSDYPWRIFISRETFALWSVFEIMHYVNYKNFKNALTEVRGDAWHDAALNVWVDMLAVEDVDSRSRPYAGLSPSELELLVKEEEESPEDLHTQLIEANQSEEVN